MSDFLEKYEYKQVLHYFEELTRIPHGSGNTKEISDFLAAFAREQGAEFFQDKANNLILRKPATSGYEKAPVVMLQGHMDMVCEKNADTVHDFRKDPLKLRLVSDDLMATGTTLGGDDGIAVAYMMALLADREAKHPELEFVITTDEETGMDGAKALDLSESKASYLINVDSEEEGVVLVSCAGGLRQDCVLPVKRVTKSGKKFRIEILGLQGGHSGSEIHKNRCNAVFLMARFLFELRELAEYSLYTFDGGCKDNAIPREAAVTLLATEEEEERLLSAIRQLKQVYEEELLAAEPDFSMNMEPGQKGDFDVLEPVSFEKVLFFLIQAPNGVQRMSGDIEGLVESSLNLGVLRITEAEAEFHFSLRSSKRTYRTYMQEKLDYLITFLGGESSIHGEYPAWEYRRDSRLREQFRSLYLEEYKKEPVFEAIHAGLECGLFSAKRPELDMISIGPDMKDIHTPKEALNLPSAIRVYRFLEKLLESITE